MVAPPPALAGVPFSALMDRIGHRALIEDYPITIVPSLASAAADPITISNADALLVVGDPAYQHLPRLPESRNEALAVAGHYAHAKVLLDRQATVKNLLADIQDASVFHFAGHAVVNNLAPELSSLMFAGEEGDDARLYLYEVPLHKARLKLVVLSACDTSSSNAGPSGTLNLSRAFLAGGARAVVGTLWAMPDTEAADFSMRLHHALTRGESVQKAMRSAQLEMKSRAKDGSMNWAGFCLWKGNPVHEEVRK
jgi:CHAT domain-containing protein